MDVRSRVRCAVQLGPDPVLTPFGCVCGGRQQRVQRVERIVRTFEL